MTVLVRDKPGSNFMPAAAVVSGGGVMPGSGLSRRTGSGRRPVGFACRDLEATNLLARQVEFFGDVFLLDFPASTSREDLSAELNLGVGNELPGLLLGLFEGGRSATDTGHRVGHLSIIAPQLRPTYQRPRMCKPQSRMPQSLWHRVVETTPDHQQQEPPLAVSKRLRSEIFRRDNSTCRYCGAKAPAVEITIDHVIPVTLGGSDEPSNLVTACADCNNGKTSVPPDAATVKQVSEDAFRWARAMEAAAEKTVGDRQAARTAFDQKWRAWSEGRPPIPRPEDWGLSIDRFLKAGLPLSVLLDCVDVAMSARQIKADAVFKYMCGVAWKEVRKLQDAAKASLGFTQEVLTSEGEEEYLDPDDEEYEADFDPRLTVGRESLAVEFLAWFDLPEIDYFIGQAREEYEEVWEGEPSKAILHMRAAKETMTQSRWDINHLTTAVDELLDLLPYDEVEKAQAEAHEQMPEGAAKKPPQLRNARYLREVANRLVMNRAEAFLTSLPDEERAEWITYAVAWHGPASRWNKNAELPEDKKIKYAAHVARVVKDGRHYPTMCLARGEHIEKCPRRAQYWVYLNEFDCCTAENESEHKGHQSCEHHLSLFVDGDCVNGEGEPLTVRDFKAITPPPEVDEPPF